MRRGQALAEFALVIPVFMLVLGGVIQFGIFFWDQNTLNQIARDGGRFAATVQDCSSDTAIQTAITNLENSTPFAGTFGATIVSLPHDNPPTSPCPPTDNTQVLWVKVEVNATVPVFFPWVGGHISSAATYRMEPKP
jgi:hypothetical protein